ncbi:MAG: glycosyltransferase family 4 protein [Alphaproteobacteria bacterium]
MINEKKKPIILNIMDSSLMDLEAKGVIDSVPRLYNPDGAFEKVLHFTPHERDQKLSPWLEQFNIELFVHPASGLSPFKIIKTVTRMWRLLKDRKVDLVRGRLPYLGSLMGVVAARLRGRPFVVSLGGDNRIVQERNKVYNYHSKIISFTMEALVLRLATRIIVPNHYTLDYVGGIIGPAPAYEKCVRIPWLSDPIEKTEPKPSALSELPIDDDSDFIVIIGFLNRYKFSDVIFDVLEKFLAENKTSEKNLKFVFCGDGPLRSEGEHKFAATNDVVFLGWTHRTIVQALMRRARLVLIPMSGFVLLEAASLGKPVITSNIEWHTEMIIDGETGLSVTPNEPSEWLDALHWMLEHSDESLAMGEQLEALYWREYDPSLSIASERALYDTLIGNSS